MDRDGFVEGGGGAMSGGGSSSNQSSSPNPTITAAMFERKYIVSPRELDGTEFDFIIVGAGSAGCSLTRKLCVESDYSVLLIEAGGEGQNTEAVADPKLLVTTWNSDVDWGYVSEPLKYAKHADGRPRHTFLERGKTLGGSSAINAMMWVRGAKEDYDRWSKQAGAKGWEHENVVNNFKEIEAVDADIRNDGTILGEPGEMRGGEGALRISALLPTTIESAFEKAAVSCGMKRTGDYNGEMARDGRKYNNNIVGRTQYNADPSADHDGMKGRGRRRDAFSAFVEPLVKTHGHQVSRLHVQPVQTVF
jgi:choline dehydrogenase-like flavoprotein